MPDFKTLVKDFYQSYDPEAYSEEVSDELVKEYSSDPDKFLTDFYQSYDPDAYSEESNVEILKEYNLYNSKKKRPRRSIFRRTTPRGDSTDGGSRRYGICFGRWFFGFSRLEG
jgi:hypothetical protein